MAVWILIGLLALLKLPLVGLMMWMPFRADQSVLDGPDSSQDDGGSKTLPSAPDGRRHPRGPLPRTPRRGPHGGAELPSPPRSRPLRTCAPRPSGAHRH